MILVNISFSFIWPIFIWADWSNKQTPTFWFLMKSFKIHGKAALTAVIVKMVWFVTCMSSVVCAQIMVCLLFQTIIVFLLQFFNLYSVFKDCSVYHVLLILIAQIVWYAILTHVFVSNIAENTQNLYYIAYRISLFKWKQDFFAIINYPRVLVAVVLSNFVRILAAAIIFANDVHHAWIYIFSTSLHTFLLCYGLYNI